MLWDIVFEFFIKYVFGGNLGGNYYYALLGDLFDITDPSDIYTEECYTSTFVGLKLEGVYGSTYVMPIGNYLSFIATIITMVAIVLICCALIKKIYNMCAHIIG